MAKANTLSITQAVNLSTGNCVNSPGTPLIKGVLGAHRYDWRYAEDAHPSTGHGTHSFTNGSDIISHDNSYPYPQKNHFIKGTGIPADAKCIKKIDEYSFQMDKNATSTNTDTDLEQWDPDPGDLTTTVHIDVSNSTRIFIRPNWLMVYNFATYEKDCARIFSGGGQDSWDTYETGSQDGDLYLGGGNHEIIVPRGMGDKVYFNILPYKGFYNSNNYVWIWTGEGIVE